MLSRMMEPMIDLTLDDTPPPRKRSQKAQNSGNDSLQSKSLPLIVDRMLDTRKILKRSREEASSDDEVVIPEKIRHETHLRHSQSIRKRWRGLAPKSTPAIIPSINSLQETSSTGKKSQVETSSEVSQAANSSLQQKPMVLISSRVRELSLAPTPPLQTREEDASSEYRYEPSLLSEEEYLMPPRSTPTTASPTKEPLELSEDEEVEEDEEDKEGGDSDQSEISEHFSRSPSPSQRLYDSLELPLLGFRGFSGASFGFNSEKGLRAGAFMNTEDVPVCPCIKDR